jgi:ABC-type nitrate/sulfonate/bicarbonate transport system substrate-binding protein
VDHLDFGAVSTNYFNLPLWIAVSGGYLADEGIAPEVTLIEGIDEVDQRLASGELDLIFGVTENVILNREAGGDFAVIGGNVNKLPFSFIARPGIASYADLKGAKIGVSSIQSGSSSLIMRLLETHGLEHERDYTLVACGPIWARWHMLEAGEIDAGLQGAPLNYMAVDKGHVDLGDPRLMFPDFQFTALHAREAWITANEDLLHRFLRGFIRAHDRFYADKAFATQIAVAEMGIDAAYADRAWDEYTRDEIFPRDGRASHAAVDTLIDTSALIRAIPARAASTAVDYIDHQWLDKARASLCIA